MRIIQKSSRLAQFCFLNEGVVFLDEENIPYMKVRPDDDFNAVRLSDGLLDHFDHDYIVKFCPEAFLTLEED